MSIGRIEHNILSVLDLAASIEENLSMLYSRIKMLTKDPYAKLVLEYLSNECWSHRKLLGDLLSFDIERFRIEREELRGVVEHLNESFRSVREVYLRCHQIYDERELAGIIRDLERILRDLLNTYTTLRTFYEDEKSSIRKILDLLIRDSEAHSEILRELFG